MSDSYAETGRVNGTRVSLRPVRQPRRFTRWRWLWLLVPVLLVYPIYLTGRALLGVRTVEPGAAALPLDEPGMPDAVFGQVLRAHVADGFVDYTALAADAQPLRRYAATLAEMGPRSTPERFTTQAERLAYYINAYNALTLLGVVAHWPIASVHEVRGPFEPKSGFGFFWGLRFHLDGERLSLHRLEHAIIRGFGDARIHAAINCASVSCPALRSEPYRAEDLSTQLDSASRRFAGEAPHLVVDDEAREIRLSAIYGWYEEDFVGHAMRLGVGSSLLDWVVHFAPPAVAGRLERARAEGYALLFVDYDWSLNGS